MHDYNYDKPVTEGILYEHVLMDHSGWQKYGGQPVFVSEYGGIKWEADQSIHTQTTEIEK